MCSEILTLYHQDGGDRLTRRVQRFETDEDRQFAADRASTLDEALTLYAEDMRCHAPSLYREVLARLLVLKLLLGDRRGALALMRPAVSAGISMLWLGAIAGLGLISSGLLAFVRRTRQVLLARVRAQAGLGSARQVRDLLTPCVRRSGQTSSGRYVSFVVSGAGSQTADFTLHRGGEVICRSGDLKGGAFGANRR